MSWSLPRSRMTVAIPYGCMGRSTSTESTARAIRLLTFRRCTMDLPYSFTSIRRRISRGQAWSAAVPVSLRGRDVRPMRIPRARRKDEIRTFRKVDTMDLSGGALLALTPVVLLVVGLVIFCLDDLIRAPAVRYLPKPLWALIILIGSIPIGPVLYLVLGRERTAASSLPDAAERPVPQSATD